MAILHSQFTGQGRTGNEQCSTDALGLETADGAQGFNQTGEHDGVG